MTDSQLPTVSAGEPPMAEPLELRNARARAWGALFGDTHGGMQLGRYLLLGELGAGGMGVVYAAYDPELDRKVAIKVLRAQPGSRNHDDAQRLIREARALARLSHPNVVAVHDVGLVEPGVAGGGGGAGTTVFIAMEHVRGTTLRRWLADERRPWRETIAMLDQAGRGLIAAHEVGLVHRDFKPDNVMVGEDGRARVMDFGLARALEHAPPTDEDVPQDAVRPVLDYTGSGVIAGTPAYMAPEQHEGRAVDARSDQFAFCVVAWEALVGRRPFRASSIAVLSEPPEAPRPGDPVVPAWVIAVLRRGLAVDPAARYADMSALLAALADDPAKRQRRRIAVGAVLALLGLVAGGLAWDRQRREQSCQDAGAAIVEVWNDEARAGIEATIASTALSYAEDTRQRVVEGLDAYAEQWTTSREQSCRAHLVEGSIDATRAARTDACLDESRDALASWIELVQVAGPAEIASLTDATAKLPPIDPCLDEVWLARRALPLDDADARARVRDRQRRLARAHGLAALGRHDESLREAEAIEAEAEAEGMTRLRAQAALQVAKSAFGSGQLEVTRASHQRALASALAVGDDELAIQALADLTFRDASDGHHERAQAWLAMAQALLPRAEPAPGLLTTAVLDAGGTVAFMQGEYGEAAAQHEQALALAEKILPAAHPWLARSLNNLGGAQQRQGEIALATETMKRVVDIRTQALGPGHPKVASALANLGSAYGSAGRYEEAAAVLERAITLLEAAYGPDHVSLASFLISLGVTYDYQGNPRAAVPQLERAVAIVERAHGPEHPQLAQALSVLGMTVLDLDAPERAVALLQRALALQERIHGPAHPDVATTLGTLGSALFRLGRLDEAEDAQRRSLAIREDGLEPGHVDTASTRLDLARVLIERGRFDDALIEAGHARTVFEGPSGDARNAALSHIRIADSLVALGRPDEALEHYQRVSAIADELDRGELRVWAWVGIATVHEERGRWSDALAAFEQAHRFGTSAFEPDDPGLAGALVGLAVASRALGRPGPARAHAERALALRMSSSIPAWWVAEAELVLAEILAADPAERARARTLAERACAAPRAAIALRLRACDGQAGHALPDVLRSR
jgi:tetratricopeptide (TPR) repeat protein/tRNA A-37 threonylcarbamoyl transferase component Bud32